jgi:hypothetical protein
LEGGREGGHACIFICVHTRVFVYTPVSMPNAIFALLLRPAAIVVSWWLFPSAAIASKSRRRRTTSASARPAKQRRRGLGNKERGLWVEGIDREARSLLLSSEGTSTRGGDKFDRRRQQNAVLGLTYSLWIDFGGKVRPHPPAAGLRAYRHQAAKGKTDG